ncbi:MAG TPA: phospholipid carrier-dependent glycosyltransferase [Pyrinomonadaceae bacterium]
MFMQNSAGRLRLALVLISGVPRVLAALLLPNAFGDAYAYIKEVETLTAKLSGGTFHLTDLYGFWLPLYQFVCALLSVLFGHPFYVSRLVSALCGAGICLLVYEISLRLTGNRKASLAVFALIALSPLHIFNSASAMTDIPHAFLVTAGVYFVLRKRWIAAASLIALAGLTRVDSWLLILMIPALQFLEERRVSILACVILIFPPLFWLYISWKATGNALACFVERRQYMDWLLSVNPSLASFSLTGIARDTGALLLSTNTAVLAACLVAAGLTLKRLLSHVAARDAVKTREALIVKLFFFAFLSFLVSAYLTHKQPIIFPRYGLILFALGAPVLPWTFLEITRRKPFRSRKLLISIIAVCLFNASIELVYSVGYINREQTLGAVAAYLHAQFQKGQNAHIFCDDGTVLALSNIPSENFLSSSDAPREHDAFLNYLKEKKVEFLVFVDKADSTPASLFPELKSGAGNEIFQPVMHASSSFLPADIYLYSVRN